MLQPTLRTPDLLQLITAKAPRRQVDRLAPSRLGGARLLLRVTGVEDPRRVTTQHCPAPAIVRDHARIIDCDAKALLDRLPDRIHGPLRVGPVWIRPPALGLDQSLRPFTVIANR